MDVWFRSSPVNVMDQQLDSRVSNPLIAASVPPSLQTTAAVRYWILLGMRWMGLLFLLTFALLLQSQGALSGTSSSLIIAFIVGAAVNLLLILTLILPPLIGLLPPLAFFGDLILVGIFTSMSGRDPEGGALLFFVAAALGITGALLHTTLTGVVAQIIGIFATALAIFAVNDVGNAFAQPSISTPLILLLGLSGAAVIVAYGVEHRSSRLRRQMDAVGQMRADQLFEMRERIRAMYDLTYTMGSTLKYEKVLEAALEAGRIGLQLAGPGKDSDLTAGVFLFHVDDNALHVVSSRRFTRGDSLRVMEGTQGIVGESLREAIPVFGDNPRDDPELENFIAFGYCKSVVCVPLRAGYDNFGVLIYGSERIRAFNQDHSELLTAIGVQATIALQNAVLYQNLLEEKQHLVNIEDDARRKLASDLHDGPTQNVAALAMRLNYCLKLLEKKPEGLKEELLKLEEIARRTSVEIRQLLFTWRPLVLETQGLGAALKQLGDKMDETHGQRVKVTLIGDVEYQLERPQQVTIFHIVEEALNNARKHANASQVNVSIMRQDDIALLQVADNGQGFDMQAIQANNGRNNLGMINMRERASLIEGTFSVESAPGKGTLINVVIPLKVLATADANGQYRRVRPSMTKLALAAVARLEKMSVRDTKQ